MTDDYQLRKELDNYKWLFDELTKELSRQGVINISELLNKFYDQSEFDSFYSKLDDDLSSLNGHLDNLLSSLFEFNGALIDFDEDNTNVKEDLTKLKENLLDFLNVLGLLDVDLMELDSTLSNLKTQIEGDATHDGFLTYVQQLQTYIYGGQGHDMGHPTPNSLKGTLDQFSEQLAELDEGDTKLALTLSALSGYLTTFKGTLAEFQQRIIADKGQSFYDGLDQEIVKLLGAITNANQDISNHQDLIDEVQGTIGEDGDTGDDTLFGLLYNTDVTATQASQSATAITNTVNTTVTPQINQIRNTDIPAVKNKMGFNAIPANTTLQSQITNHEEVIGTDSDVGTDGTLFGLINKSIDDIDEVQLDIGDVTQLSGNVVSNINSTKSSISNVKTDLYGSNQNPSSVQEGSIKYNSNQVPSLRQQLTDLLASVGVIPTGKTVVSMYDTLNGKIGNVPDGQNLQGQITTQNGKIGNVPSGTNLQSQITTQNSKIGTVPSGQTLQGQLDTHTGQIGAVPNGKTLQGQIGTVPNGTTLQGQIGNVPSGTSIQDQITGITQNIENMQEGYTFMDTSLNFLFIPSTNFEYVFCFPQEPDRQMFDIAKSDYNFPTELITYAYAFIGNNSYREYKTTNGGATWASATITTSKTIIGVGFGSLVGITDGVSFYGNCPFTIFYDVPTKTYLYNYVDPNIHTSGYYGTWKAITDYKDFYKYTDIFDAIDNDFTRKGHTHSMSNIDGLTNSLNAKANVSHTHTTSQITDIAKSSYTLTNWETTNFSTCDVTFHKQLNMVTCIYHITTVSFANRNDHTVTASEIPSAYRPSSTFYQDICTYGGQKLDGLITVGTDGSMKIRMGTANTSMNVYGSFTYIVG